MLADQISEKTGLKIDKRQIHGQPLRLLGMHKVGVRLTVDIIPQFEAIVYREGERPENYMVAAEELAAAAEATQQPKVAEEAKAAKVTEPEASQEQKPE